MLQPAPAVLCRRAFTHHAAGLKVDEVQLLAQLQVVLGLEPKLALLAHDRQRARHLLAAHGHVCGAAAQAAGWAKREGRVGISAGRRRRPGDTPRQAP